MTDTELLEAVATVVNMSATDPKLEKKVAVFRKSGQLYIYAKTRPYWLKSNDSFTTASGDYQINLRTQFPEFLRLRFMWTVNHRITKWGEDSFHRDFPDDTDTGEPTKYISLDKNSIQLHPRADGVYTIYASYYYRPAFDTISDMPEEWHHVVLHYILMMFDAKTWTSIFYDSLKDFISEAMLTDEDDVDIVPDDMIFEVRDTSENLRR